MGLVRIVLVLDLRMKFSSEPTYYYFNSSIEAPDRFNGNLSFWHSNSEANLYSGDNTVYIKITEQTVPGTYIFAERKT